MKRSAKIGKNNAETQHQRPETESSFLMNSWNKCVRTIKISIKRKHSLFCQVIIQRLWKQAGNGYLVINCFFQCEKQNIFIKKHFYSENYALRHWSIIVCIFNMCVLYFNSKTVITFKWITLLVYFKTYALLKTRGFVLAPWAEMW